MSHLFKEASKRCKVIHDDDNFAYFKADDIEAIGDELDGSSITAKNAFNKLVDILEECNVRSLDGVEELIETINANI